MGRRALFGRQVVFPDVPRILVRSWYDKVPLVEGIPPSRSGDSSKLSLI